MSNYPLISVLITAYNRQQFIAEAILSVLASSYVDFELIIVDDCSTDGTVDIARDFEKKDQRINVYANERNLGQFQNRNRAASLAKGKYLKYVDSDDMIKPETLALMVEVMECYEDAGIGVVYGNNNIINFSKAAYKAVDSRNAYLWHYCNGGILFPGPTGCIFKRETFIQQNGFPLDLGINGDVYLNLKIAAISRTILFPGDLVYWRKHTEQVDELQQDYFKMHQERFIINQRILFGDSVPLNQRELTRIRLSIKILYMRGAFNTYFLKGKFQHFVNLFKLVNVPLFHLPMIALPLKLISPFNKHFSIIG